MYEFAKYFPLDVRKKAAKMRYPIESGRGNTTRDGYCPVGFMLNELEIAGHTGLYGAERNKMPCAPDAVEGMSRITGVAFNMTEKARVETSVRNFINTYSDRDHVWLANALGANENVSQSP